MSDRAHAMYFRYRSTRKVCGAADMREPMHPMTAPVVGERGGGGVKESEC